MDDSLEVLGTPKMYKKMHLWSKIVVIGWFIYSFIKNFYESFGWWKKMKTSWAICIPHILNYPFEINIFVDLLFVSILWFVQCYYNI